MLYMFAEHVANSTLYINCDNHAVVEILNKNRTLQKLTQDTGKNSIFFCKKHNLPVKDLKPFTVAYYIVYLNLRKYSLETMKSLLSAIALSLK